MNGAGQGEKVTWSSREQVVVVTPVPPDEVWKRLGQDADEVVIIDTPEPLYAIGQFYLGDQPLTTPTGLSLATLAASPARAHTSATSSTSL